MNATFFKHMALGFLVAAALAGLGIAGFLMIPGAAMFALLTPLWAVAVVAGLLLLFGLTGRFGYAAGVALFAVAVPAGTSRNRQRHVLGAQPQDVVASLRHGRQHLRDGCRRATQERSAATNARRLR